MSEREPYRISLFNKGEPLTADRLNEPRSAINRIITGSGDARGGRRLGTGLKATVVAVQINEVDPTGLWLRCSGPGILGEEVTPSDWRQYYVARPWMLSSRNTAHDGFTFSNYTANTRLASDGVTPESQTLVPKYLVNDIILITGPLAGGAGIEGVPNTGDSILWQDLNCDGRVWATDPPP